MAAFITYFGLAFTALFPLINPVGDALVFLGLVGTAPATVYRALARKIALTTSLFLLVVQVTGTALLRFFGISLPVMQVSGGLVIAAMGWHLLNAEEEPHPARDVALADADLTALEGKVFYPFTFPITAGPGCIVAMVTLSAHASAGRTFAELTAHAGIAVAVALLSVLVYVCYGFAPAIAARVRPQTAHGILRVIAFVLMCIGVQITWNGAETLLRTVTPP
jgi:multiple antibiotic resistance protein